MEKLRIEICEIASSIYEERMLYICEKTGHIIGKVEKFDGISVATFASHKIFEDKDFYRALGYLNQQIESFFKDCGIDIEFFNG